MFKKLEGNKVKQPLACIGGFFYPSYANQRGGGIVDFADSGSNPNASDIYLHDVTWL